MDKEVVSLYETLVKMKEFRKFLFSKWKLFVIVGITSAAIGFGLSYLAKPVYQSKLSFVLEEDSEAGGGLMSLASTFGFGSSASGGIFNAPNIINFLQTKSLVQDALLKPVKNEKKLTFAQLYINAYDLDEDYKEKSTLKNIKFLPFEDRSKFSPQKDSILRDIFAKLIDREELLVEAPYEESNITDIYVNTKSEKFSRYFPEALINIVGDYYVETKVKKSRDNIAILQFQLDSVRKALNSAMVGAAVNTDGIFGLNPAMNVKRVPGAQKQIDVQTNSAILAELVKNLEISKLELLNQTPLIEIIDTPTLPLMYKKIGKVMALIIGGFVGAFLTFLYLVIKRVKLRLKAEYEQGQKENNKKNNN